MSWSMTVNECIVENIPRILERRSLAQCAVGDLVFHGSDGGGLHPISSAPAFAPSPSHFITSGNGAQSQ